MEERKIPELEPKQERGALRVFLPLRKTLLHNFLGGIAWGLGTVLGATVLVALLVLFLNQLGAVPYLGNLVNELMRELQEAEPLAP